MRTSHLILISLAVFLISMSTTWPADARKGTVPQLSHTVVTPQQCDSTPKYYCAFVQYIAGYGNVTVDIRAYKGATDGGAFKWRLLYFKDYYWDAGCQCYRLSMSFGPSNWRTNYYLPGYYWSYSQDNTLNSSSALVRARFHYKEWTPSQGTYDWYSPILNFWLNSH